MTSYTAAQDGPRPRRSRAGGESRSQRRPSFQTLQVLDAMTNNATAKHYGMELARAAGLASGTVYPILSRLEDSGWVESGWEDDGHPTGGRPRRRFYVLTGAG